MADVELGDIDVEAQNPRPRKGGYDLLGRLMGDVPETGIFRSFAALSAENLLYLQAELATLETDWRETQEANRISLDVVKQQRIYNWDKLRHSEYADDEENQWDTALEIREKLKEYHESLLRHREIMKLAKPRKQTLMFLQEWMRRDSMGYMWLTGLDKEIWSKPNSKDLVCVDETDTWATQYLFLKYHDFIGRYIHEKPDPADEHLRNSVNYDMEIVNRVGKVITTVIGGLFPVVSIVVLYAIKDMKTRLGVLAAVTVSFSLCLSLATRAKITEVFGAAAAFAAVLVVFIGTSDSSS